MPYCNDDDPPDDPGQEQSEALAELIIRTLSACKGIEIEDSTVDDAVLALMNLCAEHYRLGHAAALADVALFNLANKDSPQ